VRGCTTGSRGEVPQERNSDIGEEKKIITILGVWQCTHSQTGAVNATYIYIYIFIQKFLYKKI
jgi:hypothetical protein